MPPSQSPQFAVCVTCRAGRSPDDERVRPGRELYETLEALCASGSQPVVLKPVECLSLCDSGCSAAISLPGKWSYLLGGLNAGMAEDLLTYAQAYAASRTGLVLPSRRPASLADMVFGRIPPLDSAADEAG